MFSIVKFLHPWRRMRPSGVAWVMMLTFRFFFLLQIFLAQPVTGKILDNSHSAYLTKEGKTEIQIGRINIPCFRMYAYMITNKY